MADRHERRSRFLEEELTRKNADNEVLKKLASGGGGGGEKESAGMKRRNEELTAKAEKSEKEIAALKKHVDCLVRNNANAESRLHEWRADGQK